MTFEAPDLIRQAIERHGKHIAILWSGGRDSTAVLHMALKVDSEIIVIFENTRCESGETWAYIRKIRDLWNLNLHMTAPEKTFWQCVKEYGLPYPRGTDGVSHSPKCCQYLKERPGDRLKKELGVTAYFTGLTKAESHQRFMSLSRYDDSGKSHDEIAFCAQRYYKKTTGEWAYHPIANWSSEDVARYFSENSLPMNEWYTKWNGLYTRGGVSAVHSVPIMGRKTLRFAPNSLLETEENSDGRARTGIHLAREIGGIFMIIDAVCPKMAEALTSGYMRELAGVSA